MSTFFPNNKFVSILTVTYQGGRNLSLLVIPTITYNLFVVLFYLDVLDLYFNYFSFNHRLC